MRSKLNRFLRYLQVEKGGSQGTIEAYRLDVERGLIPFLHQRDKFAVREVIRARKLAAIKSFFNYPVENENSDRVDTVDVTKVG